MSDSRHETGTQVEVRGEAASENPAPRSRAQQVERHTHCRGLGVKVRVVCGVKNRDDAREPRVERD